jgi:hypothetical protein
METANGANRVVKYLAHTLDSDLSQSRSKLFDRVDRNRDCNEHHQGASFL